MAEKGSKKPEGQADQWRTPKKRMKNEGVFYKELKSERVKLALTPTGKARLKQLAELNKLSRSEYLERWLASEIEGLNSARIAALEEQLAGKVSEGSLNEEIERLRTENDTLNRKCSDLESELVAVNAEQVFNVTTAKEFDKDRKFWRQKALTPEKRDRILKALGTGEQSPEYKRIKAVLDKMIAS